MSPRAGHGHHAYRVTRESSAWPERHAVPRPAPTEPEARDQRYHSPAIPITQAYIDEWLANDPELHAWREAEARPTLW